MQLETKLRRTKVLAPAKLNERKPTHPFLPQTTLGQEGFFQRLPQSPLNVEKFLYITVHMTNVVLPSIWPLLTRNASSAKFPTAPVGERGRQLCLPAGPACHHDQAQHQQDYCLKEGKRRKEGRDGNKGGRKQENNLFGTRQL